MVQKVLGWIGLTHLVIPLTPVIQVTWSLNNISGSRFNHVDLSSCCCFISQVWDIAMSLLWELPSLPTSCLFFDLNVDSDTPKPIKHMLYIRVREGRLRGFFFPSNRYFLWLFILIPQRDFGRQTTTPEQRALDWESQEFNILPRARLNKATQIYLGFLNNSQL